MNEDIPLTWITSVEGVWVTSSGQMKVQQTAAGQVYYQLIMSWVREIGQYCK